MNKRKSVLRVHIGMRIWKTTIAVLICSLMGYFLDFQPLYSIVAAIICMQSNTEESVKRGIARSIGTVTGGLFGCLIMLAVDFTPLEPFSLIYYVIAALAVIPLIYLAVAINLEESAAITCVVFFSIVLSKVSDSDAYFLALWRVCETVLGIGISLAVNMLIRNPDKKQEQKKECKDDNV